MYDNFYQISPKIEQYILREKPKSILEISGSKKRYGSVLKDVLESLNSIYELNRINLNNDIDLPAGIYTSIYPSTKLSDIESLNNYDVIFIADLLENCNIEFTCNIVKQLLEKTNKTIIAMTPLYPYNIEKLDGSEANVREYHPIAFSQFDFSYYLDSTAEGEWQFYSFFPDRKYENLSIDRLNITSNQPKNKKLKIAYILPHKNLTGGMKTLLEHVRQLSRRGHKVYVYVKSYEDSSALPAWSDLDPDNDIAGQIVIPPDENFNNYIKDIDVIVVGWITQLSEFKDVKIPVIFWEQGYEGLYGDYGRLLSSNDETIAALRELYRIPVCILSVSEIVSEVLKSKYGRLSHVLPNGIDTEFYYPNEDKSFSGTILLVGNPTLKFKGFSTALDALEKAYKYGASFKVNWVCQVKPNAITTSFPINYIVMPSQDELAKIFRNADILVSASLYESFPLPPFEAMASGVAVAALDCGGIREYSSEGENVLLAEQGDTDSLASAIVFLLNDTEARNKLAAAGYQRVQEYSFDKIILKLEDCLYSVFNWYDKGEVSING